MGCVDKVQGVVTAARDAVETIRAALPHVEAALAALEVLADRVAEAEQDIPGIPAALERAEADERRVKELTRTLREADDKFGVLMRCAINSRSAPNVFDTIYDVASWMRDDIRAVLAAAPADSNWEKRP